MTSNSSACCLPPSVGGVAVNIALAMDRRVSANLNYTVSSDVLNHCIHDVGIKHVLTSEKFMSKMNFDLDAEIVQLESLRDKVTSIDKGIAFIQANLIPAKVLEWILGLHRVSPDDLLTVIFHERFDRNAQRRTAQQRQHQPQRGCDRTRGETRFARHGARHPAILSFLRIFGHIVGRDDAWSARCLSLQSARRQADRQAGCEIQSDRAPGDSNVSQGLHAPGPARTVQHPGCGGRWRREDAA